MNNSGFRNLVQNDKGKGLPEGKSTSKPSILGSRARTSIPMTPRSVGRSSAANSFASQISAHERELSGQPPTKKFKSSAAPKGASLPNGYQDRTQMRRLDDDEELGQDDKSKRLKALEEMYKLQQIDQATFEALKEQIGIGGDTSSTHLVKGLDWKLLERVRRGEDISKTVQMQKEEQAPEPAVNIDHELDNVLEQDIRAVIKPEKKETDVSESNGNDSHIITRDEILRKLKESRNVKTTADIPPQVSLGEKFKKVSSTDRSEKKKFIEIIDGRRREVLLITNQDGKTKRKVRWIDNEDFEEKRKTLAQKAQQPLGMEVPAEIAEKQRLLLAQQAEEEDDNDIFRGVGADYDPLANIESVSEESDNDQLDKTRKDQPNEDHVAADGNGRNYFSKSGREEGDLEKVNNPNQDPTILAALKRAAALQRREEEGTEETNMDTGDPDPEQKAKHRRFLEMLKQRDREDAQDVDLGFGESRFGDEDDEDGAVWVEGEKFDKRKTHKRGSKKRKADKDNVKDVLGVLEARKEK